MTPIKAIVLYGVQVLVRDWADNLELKALSPSTQDAEWLATSLAAYHKVEIERPTAERLSVSS